MHKKTDFSYMYPEDLVATQPQSPFRIAFFDRNRNEPRELTKIELLDQFSSGDLLVINNTKVLKRRVTTAGGLEIMFLNQTNPQTWQVLFPAREMKIGQSVVLPQNIEMKLLSKGLPQIVQLSAVVDDNFFAKNAELALPPYIQKARKARHNRPEEESWYQTEWATHFGSFAAPTASLHFTQEDLAELKIRGVEVAELTLHIGIGTFLPIKSETIEDHKMHSEWVAIPKATIQKVKLAQKNGNKIWALGTTVTRALESWAQSKLSDTVSGDFVGNSDLFIRPGYQFSVVNALLTNFHQPESSLLVLVSAFAERKSVLQVYEWAIERRFRLFSYGDLTVWI